MKTLRLLLSGLALLAGLGLRAQTQYPAAGTLASGDKVRVLQQSGENYVTRDMPAYQLLSGIGSGADRGQTNFIHIAYRTDGAAGSGTATDPYDGSTYLKFDTLLSNAPRHTIIYLWPSTNYQTRGAAAHAYGDVNSYRGIRKFVSLIGIGGSAETRITLRSDATNTFGTSNIQTFLFGEASNGLIYDSDNTGVRFEGLEIDCNAQNNPMTNYCINGVALVSHRATVRDVVVRNTRGTDGIESFGMLLTDNSDHGTNMPPMAGGSLVDGYQFLGNVTDVHHAVSWIYPTNYSYTTALYVGYRNTNYSYLRRSTIRNCTITSTNGWTWVGIGADRSADISGNYVGQTVNGFYCDTGEMTDVDIHNNTFRDLSCYGIRLKNVGATGIRIRDNSFTWTSKEFSQQPSATAARYLLNLDPAASMVQSNIVFAGNQISFPTNAPSSTYYLYLSIRGASGLVTNVVVRDNIIPFAGTYSAPANGLGVTHANNRTFTWSQMATNDAATP
jgi:hypothetical protein